MAIVNFTIPKNLERRITSTMKEKGFVSKAEFFRFSAIYFIDILERRAGTEEERFDYLTRTLQEEISEYYRSKTPSSLKQQLADV